MRSVLTWIAMCSAGVGVLADVGSAADPPANPLARPNILYFYVDDMGWGSIGPNGQAERRAVGKAFVRTPNIDELARRGVNFTRGYGCHVCSPARSSQQSGFHQGHTFADRNDPNNAKKAMRSADRLMGDMLSEAGYVTGYWGKWGYGGSKDLKRPEIVNVQTLPTSHGYRHVLAELHHVRAHTFFQPTLWQAPAPSGVVGGLQLVPNSMSAYQGHASYPNEPALQNHSDYPSNAYCDDAYAMAALDFVRRQATHYQRTGQPFFGLLAVQIPHAPFGEITSLPEWDRLYRDDPSFASLSDQTRQWSAMVSRIDAHFGNILAALEDPNQDGDTSDSVVDDTLVVFQSDNGGPSGKNNVELNANGGLRGTKGSIFEGGIRVPLVMRWPAAIHEQSKLRAGTNTSLPVDVTDLLPTFCELAGTKPPLGIDGVSLAPTLRGSGLQRTRAYLIHEASDGQSIIQGDTKLIRYQRKPRQSVRFELYDLKNDPSETQDLAANQPDLVDELTGKLLAERVTEPRGFANTYHHWTGATGVSVADPDNWSDYEYSNAGITYQSDRGAPHLAWIARITPPGESAKPARADANLECLALEVSGTGEEQTQTLTVESQVRVTGRNEIRIGAHGRIHLRGGQLDSERWVDILPLGQVSGHGEIRASVFNAGNLDVAGAPSPVVRVAGDYHQRPGSTLSVSVTAAEPALVVSGQVYLAGRLDLANTNTTELQPGETAVILSAQQVSGEWDDSLTASDGKQYSLQYSPTQVTLVAH